jgi:ribosomal protein S18 acetylase RimI-like enzyme
MPEPCLGPRPSGCAGRNRATVARRAGVADSDLDHGPLTIHIDLIATLRAAPPAPRTTSEIMVASVAPHQVLTQEGCQVPDPPSLRPLRTSEISDVGDLGRTIWREHYPGIISSAQIEYMLRDKYTESDLVPYIDASDRWFDVLRVAGNLSGFLRTSWAGHDQLKLEEIYVSASMRGKGYGKLLLDRAEALAAQRRCRCVSLYVNRKNEGSIAAYRRHGYAIRESKVFDLGSGFVMHDYVMEKPLLTRCGP